MNARRGPQAIPWMRFLISVNPRSDVPDQQNKEYFFLKILDIETS